MFIRLNSIGIFAHHGVYAEEIERGNNFEIDLQVQVPDTFGTSTDKIVDAVDYSALYKIVITVSESQRYNLLEAFANDICKKVLKDFSVVQNVTVKIRKLHPPVGGDIKDVEVELMLQQNA